MFQDRYDYERAEVELKMAQKATTPEAVKAHYELANRYLDRFYNPEASQLDAHGQFRGAQVN